jgi:hypothetical protein
MGTDSRRGEKKAGIETETINPKFTKAARKRLSQRSKKVFSAETQT